MSIQKTTDAAATDAPPPHETAANSEKPRSIAHKLTALPDVLVAAVASIFFGLSYGLNYGDSNQAAYMLEALRLLDPTVLVKDWYAAGPVNYHPAFAYIGWLLLALDRGGFWVGALTVATAACGAYCFYWLATLLFERRIALASFLFFIPIMMTTRTHNVAGSYAFEYVLQPSSLGSLFLLAALPPFVAGRYLYSGIFLGLSGLFHANYLILGIATFGFAQLTLGKKDLLKRLLHQLGPSLLVLAIFAPLILRSTSSPDAARARDILFNVRSPHHYAPKTFKPAFFVEAAWHMLGLGAGAWMLRGPDERKKRFGILLLAFGLLLWVGTAFSVLLSSERVTQLFVWRFAPFQALLLGFLFCAAMVQVAIRPELAPRIRLSGFMIALAGCISIGLAGGYKATATLNLLLLVLVPAGLGLLVLQVNRLGKVQKLAQWNARHGAWLVAIFAGFICVSTAWPYIREFRAHSNVLQKNLDPEREMCAWIRANTPKDAIFLTPPNLERVRLVGERAIIVNWGGSPYSPSDVVEWYHRLEDVSGRNGFRKGTDVDEGYASLDATRLALLKQKYQFDYVVVAAGRERDIPGKVVYQNAQFVVIAPAS